MSPERRRTRRLWEQKNWKNQKLDCIERTTNSDRKFGPRTVLPIIQVLYVRIPDLGIVVPISAKQRASSVAENPHLNERDAGLILILGSTLPSLIIIIKNLKRVMVRDGICGESAGEKMVLGVSNSFYVVFYPIFRLLLSLTMPRFSFSFRKNMKRVMVRDGICGE